jgi:uncharacterized membrane protein
MFKNLSHQFLFFIILSIGIILRFYNINFDDLWYDEIISFWVAHPGHLFNESLNIHKDIEIAPFTFNLLLRFFYQIFGYEIDYARYLPSLLSVLTILIVYKLSKLLDKNNSFLMTTFLVSLNIFLINYAQEQRVYSILIFFSSLSLLFFFKLLKENVKFFDICVFFFATLSLTFLHLFSLFIIFSYFLYLVLIFLKKKQKFFELNIALGIILIGALVFYIPYVLSFSENLNSNLEVNYSWNKNPSLKFFTNFYFSNFFGSRIMGLIFLLTFFSLIFKYRTIFLNLEKQTLLLIIIFMSYFIPLSFGYLFKPILLPRYVGYTVVLIIILMSSLLFKIKNNNFKIFTILFLILMTVGNMFTEQAFKQFYKKRVQGKPAYTNAIQYIHSTGYKEYILKVEKMKNNTATINSINNYIQHLSEKHSTKIKFVDYKKIVNQPVWILCPMDINKKSCPLPNEVKDFKILKEKHFNSINLKLIKK